MTPPLDYRDHVAEVLCADPRYDNGSLAAGHKYIRQQANIVRPYRLQDFGGVLSIVQPESQEHWRVRFQKAYKLGVCETLLTGHIDCAFAKDLLKENEIDYSVEAERKLIISALNEAPKLIKLWIPEMKIRGGYLQTGDSVERII